MMKRIFTLSLLMIAFVMNAVAQWNQDAKIEEIHWFGMHEFYNSPLFTFNIDYYFNYANFSGINGWELETSSNTTSLLYGQIGEEKLENGQYIDTRFNAHIGNNNYNPTNEGNYSHNTNTWCFAISARWENNYAAFQQTTKKNLPAGTYRLSYDVQNRQDDNYNQNVIYDNLFYVEVGGNRIQDNRTEWMTPQTDWTNHTIDFTVDGTQDVTISLGYGNSNNNFDAQRSPVLFVSNMRLEQLSTSDTNDPRIVWGGDNGRYLESITVIKDWTGQDPKQQPKTSFYSWLDHQLRFSVNNINSWEFGSALQNYYGLKNRSGNGENFTIHNLSQGDSINIEYNVDSNNNYPASLVSGSLSGVNANDAINSKESGELKYYEVSADGDVCINIPSGAVIRAVRIIMKEYEVADMDVTELGDADFTKYLGEGYDPSSFGYRYSFKNPGVLEDKRGAVPYITMKFGNDNDMTFVRTVGDKSYSYGENPVELDDSEVTIYAKENGGNPIGATPNNEGVYVVHSSSNATYEWDTQFWISAPYPLPNVGQIVHVEFDYKADQAASVSTQSHSSPGNYLDWRAVGTLSFETEFKHFEGDITLQSGVDNEDRPWSMAGWQSLAFNLNDNKTLETNFYFKNIKLSIPERTEAFSSEDLAAASIINKHNEWDPDKHQYHIKWVLSGNNTDPNPTKERSRDAEELEDMFVGKEWSVFTAEHDDNANYTAGDIHNGQLVVWRDIFNTIYPLSGNYFYFFPEVDGKLVVEFYCEGAQENTAFWWKNDANGNPMDGTVQDQVNCQQYNSAGASIGGSIGRTDGTNNYYLTADVKKGCVYYLCSLPTNNAHEHPIIRLKSYAFIPSFRVTPLYKVVKNTEVNTSATQHVAEIIGGPYDDLGGQTPGSHNYTYELTGNYTRNAEPEARVKCLGNVVSATATVESEYDANTDKTRQYLSFSNIVFRSGTNANGEAYNPGGAVVAHVNGAEGQASFVLTIAYDAADAKWNDDKTQRVAADVAEGEKVEVKHWDFYSGKGDKVVNATTGETGWDLGKYGEDDGTRFNPAYTIDDPENAGWKAKSKLFKETNKADGQTADWEYDWVDVQNKKEPLYKSIYDMAGDNADMIHETAGLVFFTDPNELGIWNENETPTSSFQDRFIGLMGGGKLIIPRLNADDRVVIKMGCFGNAESASRGTADFEQEAVLWLTNAKDAKGTAIPAETNYVIGGSTPFEGETVPRGEYHFMVNATSNSDATDFAIELKEGGLLKIYSIDIYRNAANDNADILTENEFAGDKPEILYTDKDNGATQKFKVKLNYSGFEETQTMDVNKLKTPSQFESYRTGKFKASASLPTFTLTNGQFESNDAIAHDMFGTFRSRIGVLEQNNTYVTDYADGDLAVGYRETKTYPYTWDFTDLKKYVSGSDSKYGLDGSGNEKNISTITVDNEEVTLDELKVWDQFGLRVNSETATGTLFVSGGQLYGDQTMFEETKGMGIMHNNNNNALTLAGTVSNESRSAVTRGTTVTDGGIIFNDGAALIPSVAKGEAVYMRAKAEGEGTHSVKYEWRSVGDNNYGEGTTYTPTAAGNGDVIIYLPQTESGEKDVKISLQGYKVLKAAVGTPKSTNIKGWTTESREYVIDPALTSYLTGKDLRTYLVTDVQYANRKVILTRIDGGGYDYLMPETTTTPDENACIIWNAGTDGNGGGALDFHLFKPDMHEDKTAWTGTLSSLMLSQLNPTDDEDEDTWIPRKNNDGTINYAFTYMYVDIDPEDGSLVGSSSPKNGDQAFYSIYKYGAGSDGHQGYLPIDVTSSGGKAPARFSITMIDGDEATGVTTLPNIETDGEIRFYNLSGQQLSGKPNRSGLYIVNGKKVYIKNK